jgi:hypothetical protein
MADHSSLDNLRLINAGLSGTITVICKGVKYGGKFVPGAGSACEGLAIGLEIVNGVIVNGAEVCAEHDPDTANAIARALFTLAAEIALGEVAFAFLGGGGLAIVGAGLCQG